MLKWTVRWLLTTYYSYREPDIVCVTFDDDDCKQNQKFDSSSQCCWSFSVYLVDSGRSSPAQLRQSIVDNVKDQPALKLVRKAKAFRWIYLWKHPENEKRTFNRMSSICQELPPVWKHQLVTEDTVHVNRDDDQFKLLSYSYILSSYFFPYSIGVRVGSLPTIGRN